MNPEIQNLSPEAQNVNHEVQNLNPEIQLLNPEVQLLNPEARVLNSEAQFYGFTIVLPWCPNQETFYLEYTLPPPPMLGKMNETNETTTDVMQNERNK